MSLDPYHGKPGLFIPLKAGDKFAFTLWYNMYSQPFYLDLLKLLKSGPVPDKILRGISYLYGKNEKLFPLVNSFKPKLCI